MCSGSPRHSKSSVYYSKIFLQCDMCLLLLKLLLWDVVLTPTLHACIVSNGPFAPKEEKINTEYLTEYPIYCYKILFSKYSACEDIP